MHLAAFPTRGPITSVFRLSVQRNNTLYFSAGPGGFRPPLSSYARLCARPGNPGSRTLVCGALDTRVKAGYDTESETQMLGTQH